MKAWDGMWDGIGRLQQRHNQVAALVGAAVGKRVSHSLEPRSGVLRGAVVLENIRRLSPLGHLETACHATPGAGNWEARHRLLGRSRVYRMRCLNPRLFLPRARSASICAFGLAWAIR